jgi:tetratricopeptide (TPR) repeat protein
MRRWRGEPEGRTEGGLGPLLERAERALVDGRYEEAFAALHDASQRQSDNGERAAVYLQLAACYALYGPDGVEGGAPALSAAVAADPKLASDPLYQALYWSFDAFRGGVESEIKRGLRAIGSGAPAVARFHAAAALLAVGAFKGALRALKGIDPDELPASLRWRRASLLGQAHEALSEWPEAASAYLNAAEGAPASERESERLAHAHTLLELGRSLELLPLLEVIDEGLLTPHDVGHKRYLEGRTHLELGNPNLALEAFAEVADYDADAADEFSLHYASAQALAALQRFDEALERFDAAIQAAPGEHRPFAQHEAAIVLIEAERFDEALPRLERVVADPSYPHAAEALADLADVRVRAGDLEAAQRDAERALELGAAGPANLVLGAIAYEYFRLDEAIRCYEQALSAALPGDPVWVAAHQMLTDLHAQRGEVGAEQALRHAQAALPYTDAGSDWRLPLEERILWARNLLGGHDRVLN